MPQELPNLERLEPGFSSTSLNIQPMSISKAKVPAWDKLGVDGSRKVLFTASDTYDWLICGFRVFVCWGSDWPWVTHAVSAVPECLTPATLLALSNFNSLVAVAYSEWLNVLIIELDAHSGALNIIRIPNESPMTFTAYKFIQILVNSRFVALARFFQTVAFRSFRPMTSLNLNRRKSVKIMRRATMMRTCPGWSWSTCSRPGIRHLSCHGWLCFLNYVIMFVLFVSKHVFTFLYIFMLLWFVGPSRDCPAMCQILWDSGHRRCHGNLQV